MDSRFAAPAPTRASRSRNLRVVTWVGLLVVLAVGFLGYLTPGMRLNWDAIAAMCGF